MSERPSPPGGGVGRSVGWRTATMGGLSAFAAVAILGQVAASAVWLVSPGVVPYSTFVRLGWLYMGAFHHVAIIVRAADVDFGGLIGGGAFGSSPPTTGSASAQIAMALLLVTALAIWLLFRAGHRAAATDGGGALERTLVGCGVAPGYALPFFALALLVRLRTDVSFGVFAAGHVEARLSPVQALVVPLVLAALAGAAGGFASAGAGAGGDPLRRLAGALAGGWRMFVLGLGLAYLGLFVAGAIVSDGPAAGLTPSTASYYRVVFARLDVGAVVLGHHLSVAPNEALWALVPAMGGCDRAAGSVSGDFLCYWRFPTVLSSDPSSLRASFGTAPWGYFLFLLAPAGATLWGGRRAAVRGRARSHSEAGAIGAMAGPVFAALVAGAGFLASVSTSYAVDLQGRARAGSVRVGPGLLAAALLALAWGTVGGWLGGRWGRGASPEPDLHEMPVGIRG